LIHLEAITGLKDLFEKHPYVITDHFSVILLAMLELLSDSEASVRSGVFGLLQFILEDLEEVNHFIPK
jgi:hypothetical protein